MFNGRTISLITLSPIQKYEEIFISYVDFTQSRDLRRAELRQRYFFQCECEKCKDDLSPYEIFLRTQKTGEDGGLDGFIKPDKLRTHAKNSINLLTTCPDLRNEIRAASEKIYSLLPSIHSSAPDTRLPLLKQALSDLKSLTQNSLYALPPYPSLLDELYLSLLSSSLPRALILLLFIFLNCDIYNWPQAHHPVRVTRLLTIARLLKYTASLGLQGVAAELPQIPQDVLRRIDWIDSVDVVLGLVEGLGRKSHGDGSRFIERVKEEVREVESVQKQRLGGLGGVVVDLEGGGRDERREGMVSTEKVFSQLRELAGYAMEVVKM
jgi:hypothetical protein